CQQYNSYPHCF
nr:immunoglobulin light chain junction region [Macaca mulatta]